MPRTEYSPALPMGRMLGEKPRTTGPRHCPSGGSPLDITMPMVAKANYDKARGGLVLVPSAPGAQQLRDAEWKGWSVSWKSYVRALQPARPVGFKVLGARAQALRD